MVSKSDGGHIGALCSHAEQVVEQERARDESLRTKMAARASERGKSGVAGSSRMADDYSMFPDTMGRRGCVASAGEVEPLRVC
jgi:hypothetical protein